MHVRKGNQLDARRGNSVESWKLAARGVEGQRKSLGAVSEEITPSHCVVLVKGMVDLCDHTGQVVVRRSNHLGVGPRLAFGVWQTTDILALAGSGRRSSEGSRDIRLGPKLQQSGSHRVRGAPSRNDSSIVDGNLSWVRNARQGNDTNALPLALVIQKIECFVLQ